MKNYQETTKATTAKNLKYGDIVRFGNIVQGFTYSTVRRVTTRTKTRVDILLNDNKDNHDWVLPFTGLQRIFFVVNNRSTLKKEKGN